MCMYLYIYLCDVLMCVCKWCMCIRGGTRHFCAVGKVWMLRPQWNTIFTSHSKLEFIYSVEAWHKTQLINIFNLQQKIYNVTFLALTDANSSVTSSKIMVFAVSYSLLGQQSGKWFGHQFYACDLMYHKNIFHRVGNLPILKILF
jgi:hypothetical protein